MTIELLSRHDKIYYGLGWHIHVHIWQWLLWAVWKGTLWPCLTNIPMLRYDNHSYGLLWKISLRNKSESSSPSIAIHLSSQTTDLQIQFWKGWSTKQIHTAFFHFLIVVTFLPDTNVHLSDSAMNANINSGSVGIIVYGQDSFLECILHTDASLIFWKTSKAFCVVTMLMLLGRKNTVV